MRIAEKILIGLALAAILFKLQHWPFAGPLIVLSISALALLYFQFAQHWFGRPKREDQIPWLTRASGASMGIVLVGVLFTLQRWPNGSFVILLGTVGCAVLVLFTFARRNLRPELGEYHQHLLWRLSIIGGLGALSIFGRSLQQERIADTLGAATIERIDLRVRSDWAQQISDSAATGVFVLWEPDSNRMQVSDSARAHKGYLPASTFKVFNSLVALQVQAVADEHTIIPWDGIKRHSADWNEDQDMTQAIARSTVWWYQEVARRAGVERMQHWLDTVGYGTRVMGDSIHLFWLQGSLRITPMEQVHFMQRLHEEMLPFDVRHQRTVKRILPGDSTATWKLQGKTGWAIRVDEEYGWYVGWVERSGHAAYFAMNIDIRDMSGVRKRKALTYALLQKEGWIAP